MACAGGALALCARCARFVDDQTPIHLAEVYDIARGVSPPRWRLSTDHPLIGEQLPIDGDGRKRPPPCWLMSNGIDGCRFT